MTRSVHYVKTYAKLEELRRSDLIKTLSFKRIPVFRFVFQSFPLKCTTMFVRWDANLVRSKDFGTRFACSPKVLFPVISYEYSVRYVRESIDVGSNCFIFHHLPIFSWPLHTHTHIYAARVRYTRVYILCVQRARRTFRLRRYVFRPSTYNRVCLIDRCLGPYLVEI